jgi:hypothetical protein
MVVGRKAVVIRAERHTANLQAFFLMRLNFTFLAIAILVLLVIGAGSLAKSDPEDARTNIKHSRQDLRLIAYLLGGVLIMLGVIVDRLHWARRAWRIGLPCRAFSCDRNFVPNAYFTAKKHLCSRGSVTLYRRSDPANWFLDVECRRIHKSGRLSVADGCPRGKSSTDLGCPSERETLARRPR